jgi:ribosomal protein L29
MYTFLELQKMTAKDLSLELNKSRKNLAEIKMAVLAGKEKNVSKLANLKKYIARINTSLHS